MTISEKQIRAASVVLASLALLQGALVVLGWLIENTLIVRPISSAPAMQPNSAICFCLLSVSIILDQILALRRGALACAVATSLIGILTFSQYAFGTDLGIDTLIIEPFIVTYSSSPGRMAPNSALAFLLLGMALISVYHGERGRTSRLVVLTLSFVTGTIGLTTIIGFLLGLESTYGWSDFTRMAPQTALTICILSIATAIIPTNERIINSTGKVIAAAVTALLLGVSVTTMFWSWAVRDELKSVRTRISLDSQARQRILQSVIYTKVEELKSVARFFESSQTVTNIEFERFINPIVGPGSGFVAIDWSPRIENKDRAKFEAEMKDAGSALFTIRERADAHSLKDRNSAASETYYPVAFTIPLAQGTNAVGFDHFSDPIRRIAMDKADSSGQPVATEPLRLFRLRMDTEIASDFLVFVPVFEIPEKGDTSAKKKLRGYIVGVFRASTLALAALEGIPELGFQIDFRDMTSNSLIYRHTSDQAKLMNGNVAESGLSTKQFVNVAGRFWELTFTPSETYLLTARSWYPFFLLVFGLLLSVYISIYILLLTHRNDEITRLVKEKTDEIRAINENLEHTVERRTVEIEAANSALAQSEKELKSTFDCAAIGMALVATDGRWLRINSALSKIVGYTEDELLAKTFQDITYPEDLEKDLLFVKQMLDGKIDSYQMEKRYIHKDRSLVWILLSVSLVRDDNKNPIHFIAQIQDISAKRRAEEALREKTEESRRLLTILELSSDFVGMADMDGNVQYLNKGACRMLGLEDSVDIAELTIVELHPSWASSKVLSDGIPTVLANDVWYGDTALLHKDGREIPVSQQLMLHRDSQGKPFYLSTIMRDMTERSNYESELRHAKAAAEAASRTKGEFLANMSHEIRTPLTSVIGYADSLIRKELSPDEVEMALNTILTNSNHLLGVINDILDFSKIEAGKLDVEILETSLFELISDVGNLMQHKAEEQGIAFGFEYVFPIPRIFNTDPTRLKQILINLIGNAVKFTKRGGVKVVVATDLENETISFAVTDTGIGMSDEQKESLFQAFIQADTSTTRLFGGTGLGLVISRQLASKLGGTIDVESTRSRGSTFTLTIGTGPLTETMLTYSTPRIVTNRGSLKSTSPKLSGKVLLVEDGPDNQRYVSFILRKAGLDVSIAENGAIAVNSALKESFDLIFMDMQMPVMDGYTATRRLRERGCTVPIIALTANTMKQDVTKCLEAGCTDFLGKPFERKVFLDKLALFLDSKTVDGKNESPIACELEEEDELAVALIFVDKLPSRISEMEAALRAKQWEDIGMMAHRLRGAHMFGYPQLGQAAGAIENAIVAGTYDQVETLIMSLSNVIARVRLGWNHPAIEKLT